MTKILIAVFVAALLYAFFQMSKLYQQFSETQVHLVSLLEKADQDAETIRRCDAKIRELEQQLSGKDQQSGRSNEPKTR